MVLNYYPGCTLKNQAADLDRCARVSAEALGITLAELPQWQCCGGVYPMATDEIATRLSAVRALAEAGERTGTLVTVCSACHHVLKRTNEDLKRDETFRTRANGYLALPRPYEGQTRVIHFLELLRDTVGFEKLKQAVTRPLTGRRIGAYYGCLLLRPGKDMKLDDPEDPRILEDFLRALGAEPVPFAMRNECCGGYVTLENRPLAAARAQAVVDNAEAQGVELLVTACPLCKYNLMQNAAGVPTVYFTQLLAEALGLTEEG
ncbi:MAG: CoB--CoM heterodisulfide reductase iron-sulfur subunit B family protein [Oscillospiraceae bacterium]